jgi:phage terminase large subunit
MSARTAARSSSRASSASSSILRIQTPRAFLPLLAPRRYKGARGGRASGKSHFWAEMLVEKALTQRGLRWVCIREIQKSLDQSVKLLIEDKIRALGVESYFSVYDREIRTPGDGVITFQGMQNHTAASIKSLEGYDGALIEEAQTLSQRSLDLLYPTIRKPGSELWFPWNPVRESDPVDKFFRENKDDPDFLCVEVNYYDNPWLPDVSRRDMERDKRRDPDKYAHIWLGGYQRNSEARVFKNWRVGQPEEFIPLPDERRYFGADWGFSVDPTVLVCCRLVGRTLYVDAEAYRVGVEIDHTPALFDKIPGSRLWPIRADSARPETISFMNRNGFKVVAATKGPGSVEDGIEFLKSVDIVVHPSCRYTIDELTFYSWKVDKLTDEVLPVLEDKKNHVIDAVRYALESTRRAAPEPGIRRL